ncbi:MAG: hypothetical protein H2184_11390 [Candidatus Galacturonibacter soehngenii]|nr:hypothetical protein [Candidatus Galacturonibacter soehngenii]
MKKKLGKGSMSFVLFVLAVIWSVNIKRQFCLGDSILNTLGLPAWSNGNSGSHYTIIYSLLFLIPSIIVGYKFPNDLFAKTAKVASMILALISILCFVFMVLI